MSYRSLCAPSSRISQVLQVIPLSGTFRNFTSGRCGLFSSVRESPRSKIKSGDSASATSPRKFSQKEYRKYSSPNKEPLPAQKKRLSFATTAPPYYEAFTMMNYNFGPAATSFLPASLPVNLAKFLMKRSARSLAFTSQSAAFA